MTKAREAISQDIAALSVAFILLYSPNSTTVVGELSIGAIHGSVYKAKGAEQDIGGDVCWWGFREYNGLKS